MNLFYGDSITAGSNSTKRFSDYFEDSKNRGISGTTIGEYSIYPVDGQSLLSTIEYYDIWEADRIFIEYGSNDISAIMCGFIDFNKVIINFVKALDAITQINKQSIKHADIYFLSISDNPDIIKAHSKLQCDYLKDDYFKGYNFKFPVDMYSNLYLDFIKAVQKRLPVIPMIEDIDFFNENFGCISDDNLHPNAKGHYIISETIKKYL